VAQGVAIVERAINGSNQGLGYRHYSPPITAASTVAALTTTNFTPEVSQASVYNTSATPHPYFRYANGIAHRTSPTS
jgi:hypothetical protein